MGNRMSPDTGVGVFGGESVKSGVSGVSASGNRSVASDELSVIAADLSACSAAPSFDVGATSGVDAA